VNDWSGFAGDRGARRRTTLAALERDVISRYIWHATPRFPRPSDAVGAARGRRTDSVSLPIAHSSAASWRRPAPPGAKSVSRPDRPMPLNPRPALLLKTRPWIRLTLAYTADVLHIDRGHPATSDTSTATQYVTPARVTPGRRSGAFTSACRFRSLTQGPAGLRFGPSGLSDLFGLPHVRGQLQRTRQ
jgi:hypothetical protein